MGEQVTAPLTSRVPLSQGLVPSPSTSPSHKLPTFLSRASVVGRNADILAHIILLYMLLRTLLFVYRRKNGQVGPVLLSAFLKFWALWGLSYFTSLALTLYLTPFGMPWLVSMARFGFLLLISWGSHLPGASYVYDVYLHPFLDAREPEVEGQLSQLREKWAVQKQHLSDIADEILKRYAIGGISGIFGSGPGEKEVAKQQADEFDTRSGQRVNPPRLPENRLRSFSEQNFFSGENSSDNVAEVAYRGVLIPPKQATPKAAYTDSRALRESFRKRANNSSPGQPKPSDTS